MIKNEEKKDNDIYYYDINNKDRIPSTKGIL